MKRILFTIALSLGVSLATMAATDHRQTCVSAKADTVLLSEKTDDHFVVRTYRITQHDASDYAVHYQINLAKLYTDFDQNQSKLEALNHTISTILQEPNVKVLSVQIKGSASPDGTLAFNEKLAQARAEDFVNYLRTQYAGCVQCPVKMEALAASWKDCGALIQKSEMPHKDEVMKIVCGEDSEQKKECRLRQMPEAWRYLCREILPMMRCVDIDVDYTVSYDVACRKPQPQPEERVEVVEIPLSKEQSDRLEKMGEEEIHTAKHLTKKEERLAARAARKEARAAQRLARKEARIARKMARAEAKAAKKAAKELQQGLS